MESPETLGTPGSPAKDSEIPGSTGGPVVSVIIPVLNGARLVRDAIESVGMQSGISFDILAIDDGSSDGSPVVLENMSRTDRRLKVLVNGTNIGLARTLDRAIAESRGKFILILHQDCRLLGTNCLEQAVEEMTREGCDHLVGQPFQNSRDMTPSEKWFWIVRSHIPVQAIAKVATARTPLFSENKCDLLRREALEHVGGFDTYARWGGEDQILGLKLKDAGAKVLQSPALAYQLTLGSHGTVRAGLHKEYLYGRQMQHVLFATRLRAARLSQDGTIDSRLLNRASTVIWIASSLAGLLLTLVFRDDWWLLLVFAPIVARAVQLLRRAVRVRQFYLLRTLDLLIIPCLGIVADICYVGGLLNPVPFPHPPIAANEDRTA